MLNYYTFVPCLPRWTNAVPVRFSVLFCSATGPSRFGSIETRARHECLQLHGIEFDFKYLIALHLSQRPPPKFHRGPPFHLSQTLFTSAQPKQDLHYLFEFGQTSCRSLAFYLIFTTISAFSQFMGIICVLELTDFLHGDHSPVTRPLRVRVPWVRGRFPVGVPPFAVRTGVPILPHPARGTFHGMTSQFYPWWNAEGYRFNSPFLMLYMFALKTKHYTYLKNVYRPDTRRRSSTPISLSCYVFFLQKQELTVKYGTVFNQGPVFKFSHEEGYPVMQRPILKRLLLSTRME